ncbi:hypothetical protein HDV00_010049 [Rhizophlyctis rosea]|nr:hypothetical protein HDV00_010049 [Rhizophlyctis rosea]
MRIGLLCLSTLATLLAAVLADDECPTSTAAFGIQADKYPQPWTIASTGKENDAELLSVYNAIDWTQVPNSPIKPSDLSMAGYDFNNDPDCWWTASLCTKPKAPGLNADVTICPKGNSWGLTFDDGPTCASPALHTFLKANNQKASFFMLGQQVLLYPQEALEAFQDGHDIMLHSWSHPAMTTLTNLQVVAELFYTIKIVQEVTGVHAKFWRPPYGDIDDRVRAIATQLGLTAVLWNEDSNDWIINSDATQRSAIDQNFQDILGRVSTYGSTTGPIVLEHDLSDATVEIFEDWYPKVGAVYRNVMSVSQCVGSDAYWEGDVGGSGGSTSVGGGASTTSSSGSSGSTSASSGSGGSTTSSGLGGSSTPSGSGGSSTSSGSGGSSTSSGSGAGTTTSAGGSTTTTTGSTSDTTTTTAPTTTTSASTTTTSTTTTTVPQAGLSSTPTPTDQHDSPARKNDAGKIIAVAAGLAGLGALAL